MKRGRVAKLLVVFVSVFVLGMISISVHAETYEAQLDKIGTDKDGETYYINVKSIDPDILVGNSCDVTKEDLLKINNEYYSNFSDEEMEQALVQEKKNCLDYDYTLILGLHLKKNGVENFYNTYGAEFTDKNNVRIWVYDDNNEVSRNYELRYVEDYDKGILNNAVKIKSELKDRYVIYGLSVLNSVYHYGNIEDNIFQNDLVLYRFSDLKQTIKKYKKYEIVPRLQGAGGTPSINGNEGGLGVFKDGVLYALKRTGFEMNHVLYVDEAEDGTVFEKAEKRISKYFKNKVNVVVASDNYSEIQEDFLDNELNEYLGTKDVSYTGYLTKVKLDDKETDILIVEIPKDKLDKVNIHTKDYDSGVNITTGSYQVPIDVTLEIKDVIDNDLIKKASLERKINFTNAYDINLLKTASGGYVTKVEDGVVVYMPLTGSYKENAKVDVYYVKDDGTLEKIEGMAVKLDDGLYVEFTTNHFSTYAVGNEVIQNPDTGDNIILYIVIGLLAVLGLGGDIVAVRKNSK